MESKSSGLDPLFTTFEQLREVLVDYLPTLALAVAVLAGGIVLSWVLKVAVMRVSRTLSSLFSPSETAGTRQVRLPWPLSVIVANIIFALGIIFFIAVAIRILGLPGVADWIAAAAGYLPHALVAAAIVLAGYIVASVVRETTERLSGQNRALGALVFLVINTAAGLAALRQLGIDLVLLRSMLLIAAAAICGGIAFAFGTGASHSLSNIISAHYVRRAYRVGQTVRVGSYEGEILDITPTAVLIDTPNGRAMIPANKFNEEVTVLLGREGARNDI